MDTFVASLQIVQACKELLAFTCDLYDTHHRIDKTECGLKEELEVLLQLCRDVDIFLTKNYQRLTSPHISSDKPRLLCLALQYLEKEVNMYNKKVQAQINPSSSMRRTLRIMWNRPDWVEITARMTNHKISLGLAFHMIAIDLAQAESLEARISYQEVSARMTSLKRRHRSDQEFSNSRSRQRGALPAEFRDSDEKFLTLAQRVYDKMTRNVSPADGTNTRTLSLNQGKSSAAANSQRSNQTAGSGPTTEPTAGESSSNRAPQEGGRAVPDFHRDDLHDESILLTSVEIDRTAAQNVLHHLEIEREPDGRLSQKSLMELEQARNHLDTALRRSTLLQSKFSIGLPLEVHKTMLKDFSRINEISGRPIDAADNLINTLSLELEEDEAIGIKLDVTKLYMQAERLEEALILIHKTYDSAKSIWHHRREGIPKMIACLELLEQVHRSDQTIAKLYGEEANLFRAWEHIQQNPRADLRKYLREYRDSPLAYAASENLEDEVRHLLKSNPDLSRHKSAAGATPLIAAAHEKHEGVVKAILEATRNDEPTNINETDSRGDSALHAAQMPPSLEFYGSDNTQNWREVANRTTILLLDAEASIDLPNGIGQLALHIAAEQGNLEVVQTILARSSGLINAQDGSMSTPLHIAIERGHLEVVKFLVAQKADVGIKDDKERDAMHLAKDPVLCELRNDQIIKLLKAECKKRRPRERRSVLIANGQGTT